MKKWYLVLIFGVVAILALSYAVYALDYKGNYNLTVAYSVETTEYGVLSVSAVSITSEATEVFQFWDILKGGGGGLEVSDPLYKTVCEVSQNGLVLYSDLSYFRLEDGNSTDSTATIENISPGSYTIDLQIVRMDTRTTVYDRTFTEVLVP